MYKLKIKGKREGIRADYVSKVIDYWRAVFRELTKEEGRTYTVITDIRTGSVEVDMAFYRREKGTYQLKDIPLGMLERISTVADVFNLNDPLDIVPAFTDDFGIEEVEIRRGGWHIRFGIEEIEEYKAHIHQELGSIRGKVLSLSAIGVKEGVRVGLRWEVNPRRTIKMKVDSRFEKVFVENYKKTVEVHGTVLYGPLGIPVRVKDITKVIPIEKLRTPWEELRGAWEDLEIESVEFVRKIREEWANG